MWCGERAATGAQGRASPAPPLRRRYSVPETIMRKYRLAQQKSDSEEAGQGGVSPASTAARGRCCTCCGPCGGRRERDPMRKSALLRLWGRAGPAPLGSCGCQPGTRSLDGSHAELRPPRCPTPKRLRLDASRERDAFQSHRRDLMLYPDTPPEPPSSMTARKSESPTFSEQTALLTDVVSDCRTSLQPEHSTCALSDDCSFTDSSETFTKSLPTTKETESVQPQYCSLLSTSSHIDGLIDEGSLSADNDDGNVVAYDRPLSIATQNYDILEIVVSETLNMKSTPSARFVPSEKNSSPTRSAALTKRAQKIDIDEFVSNILVESLNSLTDQLETMNASMGYDKKLNIVEKEIKVKLQNTGVNTIVHLSPTSNNQIIFGNEELYNNDERQDSDHSTRKLSCFNIRESALSLETNNNLTSAESLRDNNSNHSQHPQMENFLSVANNENINKSVLHQIQKLFKDELQKSDRPENSSLTALPNISHIEVSNVDVFLDDNAGTFTEANTIEIQTQSDRDCTEALGGVGTRNYYDEIEDNTLVPRFSALPHSDSMEVNTSSSDDTEIMGSECTSLVDSLDDPNSPRSILLRRAYTNSKRSELVRSSIDILDLLPENTNQTDLHSPKEKGEAFFIRIKDDNCDCEKENIVVADHMPETIKQRLFRRHRKREQRMECVRRSKVKQLRTDVAKQRHNDSTRLHKTKKEIERECMAIINTLIDDVIARITQDEYKCMRIKERSNKIAAAKSEDNLNRRVWNRDSDKKSQLSKSKIIHSNSCDDYSKVVRGNRNSHCAQAHSHSPSTPEEQRPKRIYQKSEIHDGNNCIEILEILEYANNSHSSTEATNSDENHNSLLLKNKKSKIPVPTYEKSKKEPKSNPQKSYKNNCGRTPPLSKERNARTKHLLASMLLDVFEDGESFPDASIQRTVPYEPRTRSNSLRFKNCFDIIPEEKSSLSMESTSDGVNGRRASAPNLGDSLSSDQQQPDKKQSPTTPTSHQVLKSASTSPMPDIYKMQKTVVATTSPFQKSASTSPIRLGRSDNNRRQNAAAGPGRSQQRAESRRNDEGIQRRKSVTTQYEEQIKSIQNEPEIKRDRKIKTHNCLNRDNHLEKRKKPEKIRNARKVTRQRYDERDFTRDHSNERYERPNRRDVVSAESMEGSTSSSDSGGSLLCSLAPAWLGARRRRRRAAHTASGDWAVTVAGSCAAALPNDVEMRLRFPHGRAARAARSSRAALPLAEPAPPPCLRAVECGAECGAQCGRARARRPSVDEAGRLTLTVKKEASDSAVLASKSVKKSSDLLPDLETFRASRSKTKSSVKTRRGYSLHCWLPEQDPTQIRARNALSVLGSAIVPERKPRAPSMSERDLTGLYTPRAAHPTPAAHPAHHAHPAHPPRRRRPLFN